MKRIISIFISGLMLVAMLGNVRAESEEAFVLKYRNALLSGDTKALREFVWKTGVSEAALVGISLRQSLPLRSKILGVRIEIPSKEELESLTAPELMTDRKWYRVKEHSNKVISVEVESIKGKSWTYKMLLLEKNDRFWIAPVAPSDNATDSR